MKVLSTYRWKDVKDTYSCLYSTNSIAKGFQHPNVIGKHIKNPYYNIAARSRAKFYVVVDDYGNPLIVSCLRSWGG